MRAVEDQLGLARDMAEAMPAAYAALASLGTRWRNRGTRYPSRQLDVAVADANLEAVIGASAEDYVTEWAVA